MEIRKTWQKALILAGVVLIFFVKNLIYLDPDFGYRLQNGNVIVKEGFDAIRKDRWSYTMQGYSFVEHSWGTAVVWSGVYGVFGDQGLAVLYSLLTVGTALIAGSAVTPSWKPKFKSRLKQLADPIVILLLAVLIKHVGIRAQIISWFFLSLLVYLIYKKNAWKRYKYFTPLLFLVWANMHAGFAAGLVFLFIVVILGFVNIKSKNVCNIFKKKGKYASLIKKRASGTYEAEDLLVLTLSVLATLVNPYGFKLWEKVLFVVSDSTLRAKIVEWAPFIFRVDVATVFLLAISLVLILKVFNKLALGVVLAYFLFLYQGLSSVRHMPVWAVIATPLTVLAVNCFYDSVKNIKHAKDRFKTAYKYLYLLALLVLLLQSTIVLLSVKGFSEDGYYPREAVYYLKDKEVDGNVFSTYGWGGYLVWKYPEKKVFITGQMPSWRWSDAPADRLESAYERYNELVWEDRETSEIFEKFEINTVLLPRSSKLGQSKFTSKAGAFLEKYFRIYLPQEFSLPDKLAGKGWKVVYKDEIAVVYKRN